MGGGRARARMGAGQKRQDEEREKKPDQTQAIRAGIKGKKVTLSGLWMRFNDPYGSSFFA